MAGINRRGMLTRAGTSVPAALDFHQANGPANKEARLRHLRRRWTEAASELPAIEVLGGRDAASRNGLGAFRLSGRTTPQVFTTPADLDALIRPLHGLAGT